MDEELEEEKANSADPVSPSSSSLVTCFPSKVLPDSHISLRAIPPGSASWPVANDQNAGGDAALKDFFSKLYKDADEDTKRAMIKSYTESGGTTLSTNWAEIAKGQRSCYS